MFLLNFLIKANLPVICFLQSLSYGHVESNFDKLTVNKSPKSLKSTLNVQNWQKHFLGNHYYPQNDPSAEYSFLDPAKKN